MITVIGVPSSCESSPSISVVTVRASVFGTFLVVNLRSRVQPDVSTDQ